MPSGVVGTAIAADRQSVTIDYDPRLISDESVRQVVARLAPETQRRFDQCVMLGFALPITLGVVGHEGSTVLVCLNGLRLLGFRPQIRELFADCVICG
jgi:hypothetical protein